MVIGIPSADTNNLKRTQQMLSGVAQSCVSPHLRYFNAVHYLTLRTVRETKINFHALIFL